VAWPGSTGARWKMELMGGARLAVIEGEGVVAGLRKREEETSFGQYANAAQARMGRVRAWPARENGKGPVAGGAERPGGPTGRRAECEGKILF
jgi:hypothetical protein